MQATVNSAIQRQRKAATSVIKVIISALQDCTLHPWAASRNSLLHEDSEETADIKHAQVLNAEIRQIYQDKEDLLDVEDN